MVFEDDALGGFGPVTLLRHVSLLKRGTKTLLDAIVEKIPDATDVGLWGRAGLASVTAAATKKGYNQKAYGGAFFVNGRAKPSETLFSLASRKGDFVALSGGDVVAARAGSGLLRPGVVGRRDGARLSKRLEKVGMGADALFGGYWDLVRSNGLAVAEQARRYEETLPLPRGVETRGPSSNIMVDSRADVEAHVTLDGRLGPVVVGQGASIESFSRVMGPCYIGPKSRIFSAHIGGGTSIFEGCKIGGEVENSVVMPYTNKAHHGYVGDAYIGSWVNLGAGCTFSNLKNTYGAVRVSVGGKRLDTGMVKLGPVVGDMAKLSIGALVYAGRSVGVGSNLSGLADTDIPAFTFFDSIGGRMVELRLSSVEETQRRMMERRGQTLGRAEESLIRHAFASTAGDRRNAGVRKGTL